MSLFDRVHTMTDYYDGPRRGIADYEGQPHLYESIFDDDAGEYTNIFRLSPVPEDLFELAVEDWQIWLRWETAFHNGTTPQDTHPALPTDRQRHDELEAILKERLLIDDSNCLTALGEFRVRDDPDWSGRGFRPLEVKWSPTRSGPIDLNALIDPQELLDAGGQPWTFLAFPRDMVNEQGIPSDLEAQDYIASVQSEGVPVGIWIDTPAEDTAYAFVGPRHIAVLNQVLDRLQQSGRYPEGYAERLCERLFGKTDQS